MKFDKTDIEIIKALQTNARLNNLELSSMVNLSPTPCARRVKQLESEGVISGYHAEVSAEKIGLNLTAMVSITMDQHTADRFERFEAAASKLPEVMECYVVTGQDSDFLLKVLVRDMQHYEEFLLGRLTKLEGVSGVHSSFVLRQPISKSKLPIYRATHIKALLLTSKTKNNND